MSSRPSIVVRVWLKEDGISDLDSVARFSFPDDATLADVRVKLDGVFEFPFDFWDETLPGRVKGTAERLLPLEEMGGTVVLMRQHPLVKNVTISNQDEVVNSVLLSTDVDITSLGDVSEPKKVVDTFIHESKLMSSAIVRIWQEQVRSLTTHMVNKRKPDHRWRVKTWDEKHQLFGIFECLECHTQSTPGEGVKSMTAKKIKSVFNNFKNGHVKSLRHKQNFHSNHGLVYKASTKIEDDTDEESERDLNLELQCSEEIVQKLNDDYKGAQKPFVVLNPNMETPVIRPYLCKVKCTYCGTVMDMLPRQKNLEHNLLTHLASSKHNDSVQCKSVGNEMGGAIRSGKRGRPRAADSRDRGLNDATVLDFFKVDPCKAKGLDLGMSLLCWGYWFETVNWSGVEHFVKALLDDQLGGHVWYCEPGVKISVFNSTTNKVVTIVGTFRHLECARLSQHGGGFNDLICSKCMEITLEDDFRGRVHRESKASLKRGERSLVCVRYDHRTRPELLEESRLVIEKSRKDRLELRKMKLQICCMAVKHRQLPELLNEAVKRKDLISFLKNIINAEKSDAFGGKEALWDFLVDIGKNLNRSKQGRRFSKRTRAISQALFQFGGRQVATVFSQNLCGVGLKTLQRDRDKLVQFRSGFRPEIFQEVSRILVAAKQHYNIIGDVPIILAEDETRIKPRARWEQKYDTLIGFCGNKENHCCSFGLEVIVGDGQEGYDKIINTFKNNELGIYARVFIVNPLHESLPRLALCAIPTCNKFNAEWVREQWKLIKNMWDIYCRESVGPLIGHASDGDSRRRKLMLDDYLGKNSDLPRYSVGWEGWTMSCSILPNGDIYGFGDQDPIHNGKKLVNPLDRVSNMLVLGSEVPCMNHIQRIYDIFSHEEHNLLENDILRCDRQDWAGPQRLANRKVQILLNELLLENELHEKTLGTKLYLEICADYIDIFFSITLSIKERIVKAAKVSFFLRYWRLWFKKGDHTVATFSGVKYTEKNMLSLQAFHDVNMSCHFVVLLVCMFRDKFPSLALPFHLLGSDSCELFFSKVGGMSGYERNYDFGTLLDAGVGINRLSCYQHGEEKLIINRGHSKQVSIWSKLHPLEVGQSPPNLSDYSEVSTNELVVEALKIGFEKARELCVVLDMSPTENSVSWTWWVTPWLTETEIWKEEVNALANLSSSFEDDIELADCPPLSMVVRNEDDPEEELNEMDEWFQSERNTKKVEFESEVLFNETRHVVSSLLSDVCDPQCNAPKDKRKVDTTVTSDGKVIYKSTLVSLLVGDPNLSKDRLLRVKQASYFSLGKRKRKDPLNSHILDVGCDCAVLFQDEEQKSSKGNATKGKAKEKMTHTFWIGRVQMIKRRQNNGWKKNREPLDLLDRPADNTVSLHLQWYKQIGKSKVKYSYDVTDHIFVSLENVITTVTMTYQKGIKSIWYLDSHDRKVIDDHLRSLED